MSSSYPMAREVGGLFGRTRTGDGLAVETWTGDVIPLSAECAATADIPMAARVVADVIERAGWPRRVAVAVRKV